MSSMSRVGRPTVVFLFVSLIIGTLWPGVAKAAQVSKQVDSMGREYYLFTPDKIDPDVTYWLVVEVHGYGGQGSAGSGVRAWADRNDCIGIAPSFPNDGYQMLQKDADRQLVDIFQKLHKDFKLHDKLFLYGHSGGAQFSHRFALKYPRLVIGCCATSAGTWATGEYGGAYGKLTQAAAGIPIAISCGEKDIVPSGPNVPMTRIEWAKDFEKQLGKGQCFYKAEYWPNAGHEGDARGNAELASEAFSLGSSGMAGKDRTDFDARMKALNDSVQTGEFAHAMTGGGDLLKQMKLRNDKQTADNLAAIHWSAGPSAISGCTQAAQQFAADQMEKLSIDIENGALNEVAAIEKNPAPDAMTKLQSLYATFAGWTRVRAAVSQAAFRLRAKAG